MEDINNEVAKCKARLEQGFYEGDDSAVLLDIAVDRMIDRILGLEGSMIRLNGIELGLLGELLRVYGVQASSAGEVCKAFQTARERDYFNGFESHVIEKLRPSDVEFNGIMSRFKSLCEKSYGALQSTDDDRSSFARYASQAESSWGLGRDAAGVIRAVTLESIE